MLKSFLFSIFCVIWVSSILGQSYNSLGSLTSEAIKQQNYGLGLFYLKAVKKKYPQKLDARFWYQYGVCQKAMGEYKISNAAFSKALSLRESKYVYRDAAFWLAEGNKYLGRYKSAAKYYKKVDRYFMLEPNNYMLKKARHEQVICKYLDTTNLKKKSAKLVSDLHEEGSILGLCFINDSTILFAQSKNKHAMLFIAQKKKKVWQTDSLKVSNLFSDYQLANPSYDYKNHLLYFSACKDNECSIYETQLSSTFEFSNTRKLSLTPSSINTQPFISNSKKGTQTLYFVSNYNSEHLNIWRSKKINGQFTNPSVIKTLKHSGNTITPHYNSKTRTLYYATEWDTSIGGYDLFAYNANTKKTKRLAQNSTYNDYYPYLYKNHFYFISNKPLNKKVGGCCNHLYSFKLPKHSDTTHKKASESVYINRIEKLLPLVLYFDNDQPNPKSKDTTTKLGYSYLTERYLKRKKAYNKAYKKRGDGNNIFIKQFFNHSLPNSLSNLNTLATLLELEMKRGTKISIVAKSYTSSLASSEYNKNLAKRRVESLKNFLQRFKKGALLPYLIDQNSNLSVLYIPIGEKLEEKEVLNKPVSIEQSIYGITAIKNRTITLESIHIKSP